MSARTRAPTRARTSVRCAAAAAGVVLVALGVPACGNPEQQYCAALEQDQKMFAEMEEDTAGLALLEHRQALRNLADKAPDDLIDEWQTFLGALDAFAHTLDELGVKPDDFVDGRPPAGLDAQARSRIAASASELSSADVVDAANGIEQQAKDVCKLQLGL